MPVISIPAPVGGINARDSYANMPITDAVWLQNLIPGTNYCETAPPCEYYYPTGGPGPGPLDCATLAPYEVDSTASLLAVIGTGILWDIIDITIPAAPVTLLAAQTSGIYVYSMFQSNLIMCNGTNTPQIYDGAICTNMLAAGPTLTNLRGVITYKGRAYYWETSSQSFWYAAAGAFQGALTAFPVDTLTSKGGRITLLTTFTRDGGEGADDLFIIVMNTGEVLVYQGDDPGSAIAWELVGKFQIPKPLGVRSILRIETTTLIITYEGIVDLAKVLAGNTYPLISDKVRKILTFDPNIDATLIDYISILDFQEARSYLVNDVSQANTNKFVLLTPQALAVTKDSGAWWTYSGSAEVGFDTGTIVSSCVWQNRTYFGCHTNGHVVTPRLVSGNYNTETIESVWRPVSANGYAFSVSNYPTSAGATQQVIKNYQFPVFSSSQELGYSCYVKPFNYLTGNMTMYQNIIGTNSDFWGVGRDKFRWISTNIRLKGGGR